MGRVRLQCGNHSHDTGGEAIVLVNTEPANSVDGTDPDCVRPLDGMASLDGCE
jgi:hypothetical protein